ncbi:hypothetical protein SUGI_0120650 [Cryptomeria japonica]|nr:hypothetical protein SUGI_0120650 [Cryptomeria japonica]
MELPRFLGSLKLDELINWLTEMEEHFKYDEVEDVCPKSDRRRGKVHERAGNETKEDGAGIVGQEDGDVNAELGTREEAIKSHPGHWERKEDGAVKLLRKFGTR